MTQQYRLTTDLTLLLIRAVYMEPKPLHTLHQKCQCELATIDRLLHYSGRYSENSVTVQPQCIYLDQQQKYMKLQVSTTFL